ncbi:sugar transporter ERD6-like 5 [Hyposmocoma kahamanoa]|uniref:sugar transporter ERD6-like 5 n=1 Tax=Hyposmocoma kahamanoa TaxID=1477025 RepID=UPI000E6D8256|nr:sugar transporter ERD6-like 5 [Hyposmocoma kahamanoa]
MGVGFQIMYSALICYLSISMGIFFAWPSVTVQIFKSNSTPLHRPMSDAEISLFGSLSSIGAVVGTIIAGALFDVIGRKACAVLAAMSYVISWGLIATVTQVEVILLAVFIAGLGSSAMLIVRLFVSEICQESIRGSMTTGSLLFCSLGILLSYALGGWTSYRTMLYTFLAIAIVGVFLTGILRESPTFLMKKGRVEEAARSIAFYRHAAIDSKEVLHEMDNLRRAFNPDLIGDNTNPEEVALKPENEEKQQVREKISFWKFMRKSYPTRRALFVTLSLVALGTFQGFTVLQVYAKPLFDEAVPNMSSTVCSIIQALITLAVALMSGTLSDLSGRRPLLIYSSIAAAVCCIALGTQIQFHWAPHWVTALFMYLFSVCYTFGAGTIPYVLVTDVFLPEIKSFVSTLVIEWSWATCFILLFMFNPLVIWFGLGPVFYIFAGLCVATAVFTFFLLPETKGLPVDVVQGLFSRKR